jgi:RNAse (barnase) inhibitor barstar
MKTIQLNTTSIHDWSSFHQVFKETVGFPEFYGANMDAWIDCMSYLNDQTAEMSRITIEPGEMLSLEVLETAEFRKRCPEQFDALIECAAIVNHRYTTPVLSLVFL